MTEFRLTTPVAFLIFNRPQNTERVFEAIREAKPSQLFVIADGPRWHVSGEPENCEAARKVIERVDWECEIFTNYSEVNLGCNERVASGLNWVFAQVEIAIILEDDCVPHPSFFQFCQQLLEKYRNDERIMMVSGNNLHFGGKRAESSYYFSLINLNHIWGWATWRRAWRLYDPELKQWPEVRNSGWLFDILVDKPAVNFYYHHFEGNHTGKIRLSWDYKWLFSCWMENGLSIIPNLNLVTNIGFGPGATYANYVKSELADVPAYAMEFPLRHPNFTVQDRLADSYILARFTSMPDKEKKRKKRRKRIYKKRARLGRKLKLKGSRKKSPKRNKNLNTR